MPPNANGVGMLPVFFLRSEHLLQRHLTAESSSARRHCLGSEGCCCCRTVAQSTHASPMSAIQAWTKRMRAVPPFSTLSYQYSKPASGWLRPTVAAALRAACGTCTFPAAMSCRPSVFDFVAGCAPAGVRPGCETDVLVRSARATHDCTQSSARMPLQARRSGRGATDRAQPSVRDPLSWAHSHE